MTLSQFFALHPRVALAFSGGVDSAYLWYAAIRAGADVKAYYIKTAFQPEFEYQDALHLAELLHGNLQVIEGDILSRPEVVANPKNRCYHCKRYLFSSLLEAAAADGYGLVIDGTNASDDAGDRPGMVALRELEVKSPLRECGLTKDEIRRLSREAGLFTWNKPSYACLATRIPTGEEITAVKLSTTEHAEDYLKSLGFSDFRVRMQDGNAKLQLPEQQMTLLLENRTEILRELKQYYKNVWLDLEARHGD